MTTTAELIAAVSADDRDWVRRLHRIVDELVQPLLEQHGNRLSCRRGCSGCCVDELSVFPIEAAVIVEAHPEVLDDEPGPAGGCPFLDREGACRVYESRPYVCRTQGLPLRWAAQEDDRVVEQRDICELNELPDDAATDDPRRLELLSPQACWTLGPVEQRLHERQSCVDPTTATPARVVLRSLFSLSD